MINIENSLQKGILGIDAGGTFTDLVFWGEKDGAVSAWRKTPTLHSDLARTIENGLALILEDIRPTQITAFNLATTLATNAIVENKLRHSALILVGYDREMSEKYYKEKKFGTELVFYVNGGHDAKGNEEMPFDEQEFRVICDALPLSVESVAVSSYFSVRNPSHELKARAVLNELRPDIHVTCGHELASDLNALKRATTAALNAGLIPIVMELLNSVESVCAKYGIRVPIMIVRSDGSLVSMEWARVHPIETILSGPAASAIGACCLAGADKFGGDRGSCVFDIGGTTTDIIYLDKNGRPVLGKEGATVGSHKTLIKSIDIFTFGLGGDSRVRFSKDHDLLIGPRRVASLCSAAENDKRVIDCLEDMIIEGNYHEPIVVFKGNSARRVHGDFEKRVLAQLEEGPSTINQLVKNERMANTGILELEKMEEKGIISFAGFTPTDALTALGRLDKWDSKASLLGAQILAGEDNSIPDLCSEVCRNVSLLAAKNIFVKRFSSLGFDFAQNSGALNMIDFALFKNRSVTKYLNLHLDTDLIGVGAPTWAFINGTADALSTNCISPENAGVAGAAGAAVGTFFLKYAVLITPLSAEGGFRAHLPIGIKDFENIDEAVNETIAVIVPWIKDRALAAGAKHPSVTYKREDTEATIAGGIRKVHLSTHIYFDVED